MLDTMLSAMENNVTGTTADSCASSVSSTSNTALIKDALAQLQIDLSKMDATSWHYNKKDQLLYWTDLDISTMKVGTKLPVLRYNQATGTYTVWIATIGTQTTATGGDATYNALSGFSGYKPSTENKDKQTYEDALKLLEQANKEYGLSK